MVLLTPVQGLERLTFLNSFATQEECQVERDRIGFEMAEAYPNENNFRIECRERQVKKTQVTVENDLRTELDDLIKGFGKKRFPEQTLTIRVLSVKTLQDEIGSLPITAVQVSVYHKDGGQSYIIFIKDKEVVSWIDAGIAEPEEDDEEVDEFPGKEFA
jgi:hypothetical protein